MLEIIEVTKRFGEKTAVAHVSLTIEEGEIVSLLGPSGCGKTTLLRLIAGLEQPDEGDIRLAGRSLLGVPPHQRGFGLMFQDFALFPHLNVARNVGYGLKMRGDRPAQIEAQVGEMLALVDLAGYEAREVDSLSGGEQQRVALARALALQPSLLMLDEPLGALDRALRERLMVELRQILRRVGVTAVYVTHDQTEAYAISDRMVVMNEGRIEQAAPPEMVYARPATPFVARFLGFENVLTGRVVAEGLVETEIGRLSVNESLPASGETVSLLIKPTALALVGEEEGASQQLLEREVTAVSFRGRYFQVELTETHSGQRLVAELDERVEVGQTVRLRVDSAVLLQNLQSKIYNLKL